MSVVRQTEQNEPGEHFHVKVGVASEPHLPNYVINSLM